MPAITATIGDVLIVLEDVGSMRSGEFYEVSSVSGTQCAGLLKERCERSALALGQQAAIPLDSRYVCHVTREKKREIYEARILRYDALSKEASKTIEMLSKYETDDEEAAAITLESLGETVTVEKAKKYAQKLRDAGVTIVRRST